MSEKLRIMGKLAAADC